MLAIYIYDSVWSYSGLTTDWQIGYYYDFRDCDYLVGHNTSECLRYFPTSNICPW